MWGKTAVNEGVDGTRSSYGTAIIRPILAEHNPRYLTLYYGSNDVGFYDNDQIVGNLRYVIYQGKGERNDSCSRDIGALLRTVGLEETECHRTE